MNKPTEKMIRFANKIAWGLGMDNPPDQIKEDFKECSIFIQKDRYLQDIFESVEELKDIIISYRLWNMKNIQENKNKFYKRKYEHDKWIHDMEIKHKTNKYASEYNMPYAEEIAASDYGIFPWGNS